MEDNTIRVNIRVSRKVKSYFEGKSKETGVAQSSLMALALEEYIDQKMMIEFTTKCDNYIKMAQLNGDNKNV